MTTNPPSVSIPRAIEMVREPLAAAPLSCNREKPAMFALVDCNNFLYGLLTVSVWKRS